MGGLQIEHLESRQFLSSDGLTIVIPDLPTAGPYAGLWGGSILTVLGTSDNDQIKVHTAEGEPDTVVVDINGTFEVFPRDAVKSIHVFGLAGNDLIEVEDLGIRVKTDAGNGDDTYIGPITPPIIPPIVILPPPPWTCSLSGNVICLEPPPAPVGIPTLVRGLLTVPGSDDNDVIQLFTSPRRPGKLFVVVSNQLVVHRSGDKLKTRFVGKRHSFNLDDIQRIQVYGQYGDDHILVRRLSMGIEIVGGPGDDVVSGGWGNDTLIGGDDDDQVYGGLGDDFIDGGFGDDVIRGEMGDDKLAGGVGSDDLFGGRGQDHLNGDDGNDRLIGGRGVDVLDGGAGEDIQKDEPLQRRK